MPDQINKLLRQQTSLAKFGELALRSNDLDEILTEACRLVGDALGTDLAKVVELQEDGRTLLVRAGVGWHSGVVGVATIVATEGTSEALALETGEPMISPDIAQETRCTFAPFLVENGVRAVANVLIIGGHDQPPFGILQIDSREPRVFTERDTLFSAAMPTCSPPPWTVFASWRNCAGARPSCARDKSLKRSGAWRLA
jgi:GAF domain-containing protein